MPQPFESVLLLPWAKSDPVHPLLCHMIDVGQVALALMDRTPFRTVPGRFAAAAGCPSEAARPWLAFLTAVHDLGKCEADFQGRRLELAAALQSVGLDCRRQRQTFRHEAFTADVVSRYLAEQDGWGKSASTVGDALRGHHGSFGVEPPEPETEPRARQWEPIRRQLFETLRSLFGVPPWRADFPDHSTVGLLLAGLTVLSDWIASNTELFGLEYRGESPEKYAVRSAAQAALAVERVGLAAAPLWSGPADFRTIWPDIAQPNPLQAQVEEVSQRLAPGLVVIEAPMGEGKTEAAIYLATRWMAGGHAAGIYMALPTTATSNQMFDRYQQFLAHHHPAAAHSVQLVHGNSWLIDRATPEASPAVEREDESEAESEREQALDWFRPKKRSLLAPEGVGTVDQALMSVLHVKHGFLRLFGLAGKVLIVDEVHAYDPYMSQILTRLLQWCSALAIPVILLSATLPQEKRHALIQAYAPNATVRSGATEESYPLITWVSPNGELQAIPVAGTRQRADIHLERQWGLLGDPQAIANLVAERIQSGGCLAVIANTVDSAQAIYASLEQMKLQEGPQPVELLLFHARFPAGERQRVEQRCLDLFDKRGLLPEGDPRRTRRPARAILVATQVVEQSLDLDFDELYTELAPIDLLLQRTGRLHRHRERERSVRPALHLLLPPEGVKTFAPTVYDQYSLLRTLNAIQTATWHLPGDIRTLVGQVYHSAGQMADPDLAQAQQTWLDEQKAEAAEAKKYLVLPPYRKRFKLGTNAGNPFDEGDQGMHSYLAARTRLDDEMQRVLVVEGDAWETSLACRRAPGREVLQAVYRQMVSLPERWFQEVTPQPGYAEPIRAPHWLPGTMVLRLCNGEWRGVSGRGPVTILADPIYGLRRVKEEGESGAQI